MSDDLQTPLAADWQPCPPGMLQQIGRRRQQARASRRHIATLGLLLLAVFAGLVATRHGIQRSDRVACRQVEAMLPRYAAGRVTQQQRQSVERHLQHCSHCRGALQRLLEAAADRVARWFSSPQPQAPRRVSGEPSDNLTQRVQVVDDHALPLAIEHPVGFQAADQDRHALASDADQVRHFLV